MNLLSERFHRAIDRAKAGREFQDIAEAQAFMSQFTGVKIDDLVAQQELSDQDRAQELAFDAMEAQDADEAYRLFQEAVALDSANCDAQCGLAAMESETPGELRLRLALIVAREEARLGKAFFKETKGHFWGFTETRPYMRTRFQLAEILYAMGDLAAAKKQYAALIVLNRNDNQGVRQIYGPLCLRTGDLKSYRALRNKFKKTTDPELLWCDALAALLAGDQEAAGRALVEARRVNGFVQAYLLGHRKVPKDLPPGYSWGSREQAICAALYLIPAWAAHPQCVAWLAKQR